MSGLDGLGWPEDDNETEQTMTTQDKVIELIRQRGEAGMKKYGTTMDRADLSPLEWAQHLQEELADGLQYAERVKGALELLERARVILIRVEGDIPARHDAMHWLDEHSKQFGKVKNEN